NSLMMLSYLDPKTDNIVATDNPYFEPTPTFGTDLGHFEHRLYKYMRTYDVYMISRISRIDQIDQALYADRFLFPQPGYYNGNIYVDSKYGQGGSGSVPRYTDAYLASQPSVQLGIFGGSEVEADMNIAFTEHHVLQSGFPLKWENTTNSIEIGLP